MIAKKYQRRGLKVTPYGKGKAKCRCGFRVRGLRQSHNRGTHHMKWLDGAHKPLSDADRKRHAAGTKYAE